ncbi:MAG: hypothetical protein RL318_515 [Fibrobacterota bacterium]
MKRIEATHAGCPYLIRQKAKGLFVCLALCQLGVFFMAFVDISSSPSAWRGYALVYGPMTGSLVAALAGILIGQYQRWANISFLWNTLMVCYASIGVVQFGRPEEFFVSSGYYHHVVVLGASLFVSRWAYYGIVSISIGWVPLYWLLYCQDLQGAADRIARQGAVELTVGIALVAGLALVSLRLMEMALERAQVELDRNIAFQAQQEETIRAKTREAVLAREDAEQASRAKSEFLANMSHEIRTPLNGVLGAVEMLRHTGLNADQTGWAETISDSGNHLLGLIQDVLDYSKIEAGEMRLEARAFGLASLMGMVRGLFDAKAMEKSIELESVLGEGNPQVIGDEVRLRQVMINLLSNAVKFTREGKVSLCAAWEIDDGICQISVTVRDTGIGMDEASLQRIFERFTQADPSTTRRFGGTGLGLTISRQLVGLMGGELRASSRPGIGTEFRFAIDLPLSQEEDTREREILQAAGAKLLGRILLVEDNPTNQKVAIGLIQRLGLQVVVANNGMEALELLANDAFSLVLMDCQMPEMDGLQATTELRRWNREGGQKGRSARIPVIALTANVTTQTRSECLAAGMNDFLPKPFRVAALKDVLDRWLG